MWVKIVRTSLSACDGIFSLKETFVLGIYKFVSSELRFTFLHSLLLIRETIDKFLKCDFFF